MSCFPLPLLQHNVNKGKGEKKQERPAGLASLAAALFPSTVSMGAHSNLFFSTASRPSAPAYACPRTRAPRRGLRRSKSAGSNIGLGYGEQVVGLKHRLLVQRVHLGAE